MGQPTDLFEANSKGVQTAEFSSETLGPIPNAPDWAAITAVVLGEHRKATAAVGGFTVGQLIVSSAARTTGATFDATEAGFWVVATAENTFGAFMAIDLDNKNGTGIFLHNHRAAGIKLMQVSMGLHKTEQLDNWYAALALVTKIDPAKCSMVIPFSGELLDFDYPPGKNLIIRDPSSYWPYGVNLTVDQGKPGFVAAEGFVDFPGINTNTQLLDTQGNLITPAVGDVLLVLFPWPGFVVKSQVEIVHYCINYLPVLVPTTP